MYLVSGTQAEIIALCIELEQRRKHEELMDDVQAVLDLTSRGEPEPPRSYPQPVPNEG